MKRILSVCLAVLLVVSLCGCGSKEKNVDVEKLAADLKTQLAYDDTLTAMKPEELAFYGVEVPAGAAVVVYMSSGATGEELVTAKCASAADAQALKDSLTALVDDQAESFRRYKPEETARLEKAVFYQSGSYVVLSVSSDPAAAEQIIKGYFK